jgi:hypothetical protein
LEFADEGMKGRLANTMSLSVFFKDVATHLTDSRALSTRSVASSALELKRDKIVFNMSINGFQVSGAERVRAVDMDHVLRRWRPNIYDDVCETDVPS